MWAPSSFTTLKFGRDGKGMIERLHKPAALDLSGIHDVLRSAGLGIIKRGLAGVQGLNFTLAEIPFNSSL